MRVAAFLMAALAAPLSAQQHSHQSAHPTPEPAPVDHCAMGHLPPEKCPPKAESEGQAARDHSAMDHAAKDHSQMGHEAPANSSQEPMDHSAHGATDDKSAPGAAPESALAPRALEGPRHAADLVWGEDAMAPARRQLAEENGGMRTGMVLVERLEARLGTESGSEDGYLWDAQAWYGGDLDRLVIKTEGGGESGGSVEDAEVQALYSRAIGPFFDLQAGTRLDVEPDTRSHAVIGVQGLAPYMFHVDVALFLSDRGDLTARIEGEYDQKITQRLILQPRIEAEFSAQDIAERDIGAGITKIETGIRLRYEIVREFAPYVGLEYEAKLGETADIAKAAGKDPDGLKVLFGLRAWF
ncbi:copper resistance protein B [Erythrobacter sp.]|uniref:copper resistance protein B n=1 Tax=Erythrobacter sp. TaxID=1042 RepID=UPI001B0C09D7|nr:copper resistance protein B [Erythrobacter sp.]MBO6525725.1 copper resistance protein B [Erythrobacter sp.]MBO6529600.1 copper resistance protein B [Erythrobacter sp.]